MIKLNQLLKEETFTATNKQSGKTSVFKSKDSRDAAIKAGTHDAIKDKEQPSAPKAAGNSMFGGDYAKDRGGESSKANDEILVIYKNKARINKTKSFTDAKAAEKFADANSGTLAKMVNGKLVAYPKTTVLGKGEEPNTKAEPKSDMGVDSVVYNKRTKTVGIVRLGDEFGETKTDADGNVNTDELEPYNPMKYPHQKDAQVAPSTTKEIDSRGLWKPFAQDKETSKEEPKSEPAKKRPGNPKVNKEAKASAEKFGITPQKLGNEGYKKVMYQAAVEALTDANFHDEARELVASIEGKPEWAKKVNYPSMDDPKYKEKMADIRNNGVDSSEYWGGDDNAHEFGRKVAASSGWGGVEAADGIAFTLRMNGFHREADTIQSVFDNKPYMRNEGMIKLSKLMENDPCWKGYKQVGMKDKNGREVPNCVPESVVKEAGIPKLYLKIEAVKNKIKALEAERKSKYGGEYARKLNAETDPKRKHELAQPIFAITKQITMYQKNLLKMMDDEEKYYANMGKDDELDPNFA